MTLCECRTRSLATEATTGPSRGMAGKKRNETCDRNSVLRVVCYVNRLVSVALIPIAVTPFAAGSLSPLLDGGLIGLIIVHSYIGFQYANHMLTGNLASTIY
jgi:hypothetical protein